MKKLENLLDPRKNTAGAKSGARREFLGGAALAGIMLGASGILAPATAQQRIGAASSVRNANPITATTVGRTKTLRAVAATQPPLVTPEPWDYHPFALSDVAMGEGVYKRGHDQGLVLARAYSVDRILAVFRRNAGLDTGTATPPGGWEEYGTAPDEQRWGPAEYTRGQNKRGAGGLLRGHYGGHFLTKLAMAYATTGEEALKEKVDALVAGLEECRAALAAQTFDGKPRYSHPGFLSAYGEWQFSALEEFAPYGEIWAPYYTLHKILDGLVNAYKYTGNELALELAEGVGRWVYSRLSKCTAKQLELMWGIYIGGESGGVNDSLVELYWLSEANDRNEFLEAAKLLDLNPLIDACAEGRDTITDKHANQHIPTFVGYAKLYAATGEERYLKAVENFFEMIVPGRMYPHGGTGQGEMWGPPNSVVGNIGNRNAESCAAYNMVKVAWQLFLLTGKQKYSEYCERTVLNHILGGRRNRESTTGPENLYMFPVHAGARKEYGDGNIGTCCGGTGLESPMRYLETAYAKSKDGDVLFVNLYSGSTLTWAEKNLKLVQTTKYPQEGVINFSFSQAPTGPLTVKLRIPDWVTGKVAISVNGTAESTNVGAGSYAALTRTWKSGDVITLELPLRVRIERPIDSTNLQSVHFGPTVYSMISSETKFPVLSLYGLMDLNGNIDGSVKWDGDKLLLGSREFDPLYAGHDIQYSVYFDRKERTVIFGGRDSGVPNPAKTNGTTLLDEVWEAAPFSDREAFLERVRGVSQAYVSAGLLSARNRQRVLLTAAQARIEGGN
ncbi:beta-L-arabinofuranosidase domain-containing protein [Jonesiaceae bacterium BS-20]|uniref:Beta-L-arabinofuranosidase domain-containing protein n=1 Tax=Jonesiaceae bacterium BS-20 TaxID=3120821 RepID=A0AAU7DVI2_9MICO